MDIFVQLSAVILWILYILLFQIALWPLLRRVSREYALPLSFPVSLLFSTLISWYLALLTLPVHLVLVVPLALLISWFRTQELKTSDFYEGRVWFLIAGGTFFLTLIAKIFYNPAIDISFEKFVDSMLLTTIMRSPEIPPLDGWFAGSSLNWYYYLAAWMGAIPGHILSLPPSVVYHLIIPSVFACAAVMLYACGTLLLTRYRFLPVLLLIIPYPAFPKSVIGLLIEGISLRMILNATIGIIPGAVTENPVSALFIGSPRPYAVGLLIQTLLLFLVIYVFRFWGEIRARERIGIALLASLGIGTFIPLHTWDALIYLPLIMLTGLVISLRYGMGSGEEMQSIRSWADHLSGKVRSVRDGDVLSILRDSAGSSALLFIFLVPIISSLLYLPFLMGLDKGRMQGVTLNLSPTPLIPFLLVHGFFLIILMLWIWDDLRKTPLLLIIPAIFALSGFYSAAVILIPIIYLLFRRLKNQEELLAFIGLLCILFCEFFAMMWDGQPDRANTIYKFYFTSWVLLGLVSLILIGRFLQGSPLISNESRQKMVAILIAGAALLFPLTFLAGIPYWAPSLDGTAFVSSYVGQEEYDAITFLRSLGGDEYLIEGVVAKSFDQDDSMKYFCRVSTYTGIPSLVGSYYREEMYRGTSAVKKRTEDVIAIYRHPEKARALMSVYNSTLLYVGTPEIRAYEMNNPDVYASYGFTPIFHENMTTVWRAPGGLP